MKRIVWEDLTAKQRLEVLARPATKDNAALKETVADILCEVRKKGDKALNKFTSVFDGVKVKNIRVARKEIDNAWKGLDPSLRKAITRASINIEKFHKAERPKTINVETAPGVMCSLIWCPIEKVGLYIPAGTAPLFSALLMQAIPARVAGCKSIVLCSPPQKNGKIHPAILATAKLCGIEDVYAVGGAQAIAAMAFGTVTIPKVDKIFGPGNAYVTAAKQQVSQDPGGAAIDIPAGQSEVLIIADKGSRPDWVAADLLAQAEHDASSQVILITTDASFAVAVNQEVFKQLAVLPRRSIAVKSLSQSRVIIASTINSALAISNLYAPEHLIIHAKNAKRLLPKIQHAGSVFIGPFTPESAGDYASGTNHVLPTYGYARVYGGLNVMSYMKSMTLQNITQKALKKLGPTIIIMANAEGLDGHANAVRLRMGKR